jgi:lysophospholipase-2
LKSSPFVGQAFNSDLTKKSVLKLVEEEEKNGIPSDRIFIGGFSQGGAVALYTALSSPRRFAGVIALSTWVPMHAKITEYMKPSETKFSTPIFTGHGDSDPMVPLQWAKLSHSALQAIGFTSLTFKTYPGLSHSSSEDEMDDIDEFIKKIAQ